MAAGDEGGFDPEAAVDALAPLLGFAITPEQRPGVVVNLRLAARLAALVTECSLDDREDPAPVFEA